LIQFWGRVTRNQRCEWVMLSGGQGRRTIWSSCYCLTEYNEWEFDRHIRSTSCKCGSCTKLDLSWNICDHQVIKVGSKPRLSHRLFRDMVRKSLILFYCRWIWFFQKQCIAFLRRDICSKSCLQMQTILASGDGGIPWITLQSQTFQAWNQAQDPDDIMLNIQWVEESL